MQSAVESHPTAYRVAVMVLRALAGLMLVVTALLFYVRLRYPERVPIWLPFETLFVGIGFLVLVWDCTWRRGEVPLRLRAPLLSHNAFGISLIAYLLIALAVMVRSAVRYHTEPDSWIITAMPWVWAVALLLLVWSTMREWNKPTAQRHSIWNVVLLGGTLAAMVYSAFSY